MSVVPRPSARNAFCSRLRFGFRTLQNCAYCTCTSPSAASWFGGSPKVGEGRQCGADVAAVGLQLETRWRPRTAENRRLVHETSVSQAERVEDHFSHWTSYPIPGWITLFHLYGQSPCPLLHLFPVVGRPCFLTSLLRRSLSALLAGSSLLLQQAAPRQLKARRLVIRSCRQSKFPFSPRISSSHRGAADRSTAARASGSLVLGYCR